MTPEDCRQRQVWFFPSERRLWMPTGDAAQDHAVIAAHEDAIRLLESGCPRCLVGYADIFSDPMFHCPLCEGTGFPVFGDR